MQDAIRNILEENKNRNAVVHAVFNPYTGEGSVGERTFVAISDFPTPQQWIPKQMADIPLVRKLSRAGSVSKFLTDELEVEDSHPDRLKVIEQFVRLRCRYDFPFWAALFVYIKAKGGGEDVLFQLTRPQRKFVEILEGMRNANKPIRLVLLKARQWGGSTTSQIYMAWLQLVHKVGLNSLIIAHQGSGSDEIKAMFDRMINAYPISFLYDLGEKYNENETKLCGVGHSGSIYKVPQRNCNIKIGTAERPDSCRGGDYNLIHLSEVGIWRATDGKKPEDIVRSACSGVLYKPYTMIVYESTANGTGNFFHREYIAAREGRSQFASLFVSWFDIDLYRADFSTDKEEEDFAQMLYSRRTSDTPKSEREESGQYLWWLWEKGATLEAINWYISERKKYNDHGQMAAEYPTDDIEAFVHSGRRVFDKYKIEQLRSSCKPPHYVGEVCADAEDGKTLLKNVRFEEDSQGNFSVWDLPEQDSTNETTKDRYLVSVDVGGRWSKADWSVIAVFDRLFMMDGDKPMLVAQWYGHTDIDLLAWNAARIAKFYNNALLVIESNTIESRAAETEGDQSQFILNQIKDEYPNLYARKQSEEEIREGLPRRYGFHTNKSTKPMIISNLVKVIRENAYVERDERALSEYIVYERKPNGSFGAVTGEHDDILMTRAIGLHICFNEMPLPRVVKNEQIKPIHRHAVSAATI